MASLAWVVLAPAAAMDIGSYVREVRALESQPATAAALDRRGALITWALTAPDGPPHLWCPGLLNEDRVTQQPLKEQLIVQGMLSASAYGHGVTPQADRRAALHAGLRAALGVYEKTVAQDLGQRDPVFDALLLRRDPAALDAYIAGFDCR